MTAWVIVGACLANCVVGFLLGWSVGYADRKREEAAREHVRKAADRGAP